MIPWFLAVVTASLFGSLHCVGMCGPFVLLATKPLDRTGLDSHSSAIDTQRLTRLVHLLSYHLGRLTTYLVLGFLVGSIASATDGLAGGWGIGFAVSTMVGMTFIVLGTVRLGRLLFPTPMVVGHSPFFLKWNSLIVGFRKKLHAKSPAWNAYRWGLLSTWLPCGWLYLFVLASASAGGLLASIAMMLAFWLGTLPALSAVAWGGSWFRKIDPKTMQWVASLLLIGFGFWTVTTRASVDLTSLVRDPLVPVNKAKGLDKGAIESLEAIELPCCTPEHEGPRESRGVK